ncbi:MAG: exodeoxyribonuclease VII large subunit [Thermoleophilaceae bacterium]
MQPPRRQADRPAGIDGSAFKGPFPVGEYAAALRSRLREMARVQVFGEVSNLGIRPKAVYFELRDAAGALPCAMWRSDYDQAGVGLENGAQVVLAGGCDYYPGSASSSPSFSFRATALRLAGEGELLAQIERLRRRLDGEGLFHPQKALHRAALPHSIGVVTGEGGKARDDVLAGLRRRGWEGRLVWAFAPVQDRRAAPLITRALQDLAAVGAVDVIVVARGGGSVMDLMAFSDETLCRTVALLAVPVIASVGHHTDRTLIDDVAAVSCSTPTHAAEATVRIHAGEARTAIAAAADRLRSCGNRAVVERARRLAELSRAPDQHVARHRALLHQKLRELRASGRRGVDLRRDSAGRHLLVLGRKASATAGERDRSVISLASAGAHLGRSRDSGLTRRARDLERLRLALDAHDPERTLERGYALVEDAEGGLVTSAGAARAAREVSVRFHDDRVRATVERSDPEP